MRIFLCDNNYVLCQSDPRVSSLFSSSKNLSPLDGKRSGNELFIGHLGDPLPRSIILSEFICNNVQLAENLNEFVKSEVAIAIRIVCAHQSIERLGRKSVANLLNCLLELRRRERATVIQIKSCKQSLPIIQLQRK